MRKRQLKNFASSNILINPDFLPIKAELEQTPVPLYIKDDYVHRQAKELAALTRESLKDAVGQATDDRLAAVRQDLAPKIKGNAEQLMALGKLCAEHMSPNSHSADHAQLFNDDGMLL